MRQLQLLMRAARPHREILVALLAAASLSRAASVSIAWPLGALVAALYGWCGLMAARRIEYIAGHRAGAKGFAGGVCAAVHAQRCE